MLKIRNKLMNEAAKPNRSLRIVVGHANLFDSMVAPQGEQKMKRAYFLHHIIEPVINAPTKDLNPVEHNRSQCACSGTREEMVSHPQRENTDDSSSVDSESPPDNDSSDESEYGWDDIYFETGGIGITNVKNFELEDQV